MFGFGKPKLDEPLIRLFYYSLPMMILKYHYHGIRESVNAGEGIKLDKIDLSLYRKIFGEDNDKMDLSRYNVNDGDCFDTNRGTQVMSQIEKLSVDELLINVSITSFYSSLQYSFDFGHQDCYPVFMMTFTYYSMFLEKRLKEEYKLSKNHNGNDILNDAIYDFQYYDRSGLNFFKFEPSPGKLATIFDPIP